MKEQSKEEGKPFPPIHFPDSEFKEPYGLEKLQENIIEGYPSIKEMEAESIKNIPQKIYLILGDGFLDGADFNELHEVTWAADKIYKNDIEYVFQSKEVEDRCIKYLKSEHDFQVIQLDGLGISKEQSFEQRVNTAIAMAWKNNTEWKEAVKNLKTGHERN